MRLICTGPLGGMAVIFLIPFYFFGADAVAENTPQYHIVEKSETLGAIAKNYGVELNALVALNHLDSPNRIYPGQKILIFEAAGKPDEGVGEPKQQSKGTDCLEIKVQPKETLSLLSRKYGIALKELAELNGLDEPYDLFVGQTLLVPRNEAAQSVLDEPERLTVGLSSAEKPRQVVVAQGDSLGLIARKYGVRITDLARMNLISKPYVIYPGQSLTLPPSNGEVAVMPDTKYIVRKSQTLSEIATQFGLSIAELSDYNGLDQPNQIYAGQALLIPGGGAHEPFYHLQHDTLEQLDRIRPNSNRWKHIVIHHSGADQATPASMDRFHREERNMENGLAYHFVIGNGYRGLADGEVYIGDRWKRQIQGGHLAVHQLNENSIGICLIGDFSQKNPSTEQLNSLRELIKYLMDHTSVPLESVHTHKTIHPKHTECPGEKFPFKSFMARLQAETRHHSP